MATFKSELPNDLIKQIDSIEKNSTKMIGEMLEAGGDVVERNIKANVPSSWHGSNIMNCLKKTRVYKTPSDGGENVKIGFYGYFINEDKKKTPAPLVANVTEYGKHNGSYPKHPFLRKSFKKKEIEKAMLQVQDRYIKGG